MVNFRYKFLVLVAICTFLLLLGDKPQVTSSVVYISKAIDLPANGYFNGGGKLYLPSNGYIGNFMTLTNDGFTVENCRIEGFVNGIVVNVKPVDDKHESRILNCNIYNYRGYGILWNGLSDSYISTCIFANDVGSDGLTPLKTDPYYPLNNSITANTAIAGLKINSGGVTVSNCHFWGNERYDVWDNGSGNFYLNNRYEGGRLAMILLSGYDSHVYGGSIWSILDGKTFSYGIVPQIGIELGSNDSPTGNSDVENVWFNQTGYIPYPVALRHSSGGNFISLKTPSNYNPKCLWFNNISNKLDNLTLKKMGSSSSVWSPSDNSRN